LARNIKRARNGGPLNWGLETSHRIEVGRIPEQLAAVTAIEAFGKSDVPRSAANEAEKLPPPHARRYAAGDGIVAAQLSFTEEVQRGLPTSFLTQVARVRCGSLALF
jgi:hypothetical protein